MVARAKKQTKNKGTVLVTGASRGLGLEFVRQYLADGWRVIATSQNPAKAKELNKLIATHADLSVFQLDVTDNASVQRLAKGLRGAAIDVLINNSGIAGKGAWGAGTQQVFGTHDYAEWQKVLNTNTLGPLRVAEALLPNVKRGTQKKIVTISSMGGSIKDKTAADVKMFACDAYLTSKAAVNMAMRATALRLKEQKVIVTNFCPGWVRTEMGGPNAPLSPQQSITALRKSIAKLKLKDTGRYTDRNGKDIAW